MRRNDDATLGSTMWQDHLILSREKLCHLSETWISDERPTMKAEVWRTKKQYKPRKFVSDRVHMSTGKCQHEDQEEQHGFTERDEVTSPGKKPPLSCLLDMPATPRSLRCHTTCLRRHVFYVVQIVIFEERPTWSGMRNIEAYRLMWQIEK